MGSRLLRPYHPGLAVAPFDRQQVVDVGDVTCNPFDITVALEQIEAAAKSVLLKARSLIAIGGDHTIALPLLRALNRHSGPVALVHFDAHLDTWDTYFGAPFTHGTPFRRAAEEGLLLDGRSVHIGIRGPLYTERDLPDDTRLGFDVIPAAAYDDGGCQSVAQTIRSRVGSAPVYVSVDIDVLDPAHAPGTGTPEAGGLSSRELLGTLRALRGLPLVGGDVVEVAPAYDHAEITSLTAAHLVYEMLGLLAVTASPGASPERLTPQTVGI